MDKVVRVKKVDISTGVGLRLYRNGEYYIFAAVFIGDENNIHIMRRRIRCEL